MAAHTATLCTAPANTTGYAPINWSSLDTGANNIVFDMNGKADSSKLVILVAGESTLVCGVWIGTSDSRSSGAKASGAAYPYSAAELGRSRVKTTVVTDGNVRSIFRSTVVATTEVFAVYALGPFETARYKDSDGYINVARAITTAGGVSSSDPFYVAGLLIP